MTRLPSILASSILGLILVLIVPADAAALWLDGQCSAGLERAMWSDLSEADEAETAGDGDEGCDVDSTDPSSNACFEAAEHPISTLPELIAQTQGERLGAEMVEGVVEAMVAQMDPPTPSPDEVSLEDPVVPGIPLAERPAMPLPTTPSSCTSATTPDQCHSAPPIPHLNLEASAPAADTYRYHPEIPSLLDDVERPVPFNPGLAPASGVRTRVERPPEMT